MKAPLFSFITLFGLLNIVIITAQDRAYPYPIVDTNICDFYGDDSIISKPKPGEPFFGQDAHYQGNQPSYTNHQNGTISDNITGLMWASSMDEKMTYDEAFKKAGESKLGGYTDWRIPTIKELYSLILFSGKVGKQQASKLFIDTEYFNQPLGNVSAGEREIDAQTWSATQYKGVTMRNNATVFGVNFIDGRIKGYPMFNRRKGEAKKLFVRLVRGNPNYGTNIFVDNGDGTITDKATSLMWQKADDGIARDWKDALAYAENAEMAGYTDWRLPNAKELQSIVDYSRSPQATNSPAIDPIFITTEISYPDGTAGHYPFFWSGTTHHDGRNPYNSAVYIAFGEGLGKMRETVIDVHGAGCQRSDPKAGNIENYPQYHGPQGDIRYVYNYVRLVRDAD